MKGLISKRKYIVSLLELLDNSLIKRILLHKILKKSYKITCCEETRAYLVKRWHKLNSLPTVFPNKSFNQLTTRHVKPTINITKNIIEQIKDKNIIIYQGYIQNSEELLELAKALIITKKKYTLVLLGIDKYNSYDKIKKIYKNCMMFSYIPAPFHLEITSYARIGVVYYRPTTLNNVFCAPNKIFEYSGFGIPMIGNTIPGLKNTIGNAGAGKCIEFTCGNIVEALNEIEKNYEHYSKNAINYYNSVDNYEIMKKFLEK